MRGRSGRLQRWLALGIAILVLAGCQGGASGAGGLTGSQLLDQLAANGDRNLFDGRYIGDLSGDAILYVGTKGGAAIGFVVDPTTGGRWLAGSSSNGKIDIKDSKGGHVTGTANGSGMDASVSGMDAYNGSASLVKVGDEVAIARQASVAAGEPVGGLVLSDGVVRGMFKSQLTIGLRLAASRSRSTVDVQVATDPAFTAAEKDLVLGAIAAVQTQNSTAGTSIDDPIAVMTAVLAVTCGVVSVGASSDTAATAGLAAEQEAMNVAGAASLTTFLANALRHMSPGVGLSGKPTQPATDGPSPVPVPSIFGSVAFVSFSPSL